MLHDYMVCYHVVHTAQRLPCDRAIRTSLLIILQRGRYFYRSTLVGHSWIQDSGFWILDSTPWIPESLSVELGFRIPVARDSGINELYSIIRLSS